MPRRLLGQAWRRLLIALPPSRTLFKLCRMYVNVYSGDDDTDFTTNGEQRVLLRILPKCKVVFDVGAHIGDWTAMSLAVNPALHAHCFEPSAASCAQLRSRGFGTNVIINELGLSAEARQATLHTFGQGATTNSLYAREHVDWLGESRGTETVQLSTLDDYCAHAGVEKIDYLKIDTEGHELDVLRGASQMLRNWKIQMIQLEYGGGYIDARAYLKDVFEMLTPLGYGAHKILPRSDQPVRNYDEGLENFRLSNWLFTLADDTTRPSEQGRRESR